MDSRTNRPLKAGSLGGYAAYRPQRVGVKLAPLSLPLPKRLGVTSQGKHTLCDQDHKSSAVLPGHQPSAGKTTGLQTRTKNDRRNTARSGEGALGDTPQGILTWAYTPYPQVSPDTRHRVPVTPGSTYPKCPGQGVFSVTQGALTKPTLSTPQQTQPSTPRYPVLPAQIPLHTPPSGAHPTPRIPQGGMP